MKDTLLVTTVSSGLVALALLAVAFAVGRGWWIALFMTVATLWFAIVYLIQLRRFRRDSGGAGRQ